MAAVTIITSGGRDAGTRSDGQTKPLFIVGPQGWRAMADRLGLKEVLFIDARRNIEVTPAMERRLATRGGSGARLGGPSAAPASP